MIAFAWTNFLNHMALILLGLGALSLGGAFAAEHIFGLEPCILCIWQRWPWAAAMLAGIIGLGLKGRAVTAPAVAIAGASALLAGAGIAGYHVGVEQGWWEGYPGCSAPVMPENATFEEMRAAILARDFVSCAEIPWSLFGISMAGYNFIVSLGVGLACLAALPGLIRRERTRTQRGTDGQ